MRTVSIIVHNGRKFELFVEKRRNGFELWQVGPVQGKRTLLAHYLTHDDLETRLEYAKAEDLLWRDASKADIPAVKHRNATETEETIKLGTFWDYDDPRLDEVEASARQAFDLPDSSVPSRCSVANHLGAIALISAGRDDAERNVAAQAMLGQWTDGVVTMSLEPAHKLRWSCTDLQHPLNIGERINGHPPDWWNFVKWGMALLNSEHKCGTDVGVLRVGENELHLFESGHPHRIAHVFKRLGRPEGIAVQKPEPMKARPKKVVVGIAKPILRRLEQAVIGRNPLLAERLKPGLTESDIRNALNRASVAGAIEPLIELYSWRNGMALDDNTPMEETSFFPVDIYQFLDLETALNQFESMKQAATQLREMFEATEAHSMFSGMSGRLFPLFSDGATGTIAVDLTPSKGNPVLAIEFESTEPVRQAYGSFEEFIKDATRANRENDNLSCFQ